jgi:hypothetical protein
MKYVPELAPFATKTSLLQASPAKIIGIDAVNGEIGAENFTEVTIYTFRGLNNFWGMITFFVECGGNAQNLTGAVGNAKTASLAAVLDNDHPPHLLFFAPGICRPAARIMYRFLHELFISPACSNGCPGSMPELFLACRP